MTLENCQRLLKHYNDLADGTIPAPPRHKDWADVVANAKFRAKLMQERVDRKSSDVFRTKHNLPLLEKPKETKPEEKKSGKRSA